MISSSIQGILARIYNGPPTEINKDGFENNWTRKILYWSKRQNKYRIKFDFGFGFVIGKILSIDLSLLFLTTHQS